MADRLVSGDPLYGQPSNRNLPNSALAAGLVATICSFGLLILTLLLALGIRVTSKKAALSAGNADAVTATTPLIWAVFYLFLAFSIFGIATGIGLLLRKDWARLSCLGWSAMSLGGVSTSFLFMLFYTSDGHGVKVVLWVVFPFLATAGLINLWWLQLFSQAELVVVYGAARSSPWDCPLPLAVLGGYFLLACILTVPIFSLRATVPTMFFGHAYFQVSFRVAMISDGVVMALVGWGIWRNRAWSLPAAIVAQGFWAINYATTVVSPRSLQNFKGALNSMASLGYPPHKTDPSLQMIHNYKVSLVVALVLLGVLVYYYWRSLRARPRPNERVRAIATAP